MLSRDENLASDTPTQTRQSGGVLTPLSDNSINLSDGGKKRKRDGNTMDDLLKDPFVVRPYPSTVHVKPRTLHPLVLLPRSYLPLSSLDILSLTNPLQSRLFETHVKILELEERMGSDPMVLIARLDDGRTLYAVEREDRGLYVLCQLGSWVNLQQLRAAAVASKVELSKTAERILVEQDTAVPLITPEASKYSKKKRLAIEAIQSMVKRPPPGFLTGSQTPTAELDQLPPCQNEEQTSKTPTMDDASAQLTATEIFDNVRNQYFDALYSKASLAYFAKGPLSRARAAFHLDYDSTLDMNDHIVFLESLIMSTKLIDKKYSNGVPTCVSLIDIHDHSADDVNHALGKIKKRRSSKNMKPGKDGLYPTEDNLIRKWWAGLDDEAESGAPGSSKEETTKNRIAQLRVRETQLQIIVILEVLALHPLASTTEDLGSDLPAGPLSGAHVNGKEKPHRSKERDQLTMLIDVHIDRLCIWQDIAAEATNGSVDHQNGIVSVGSSNLSKHVENILRDFCVEVIGPFFSARLPDRCATINSKLGGPIVVSPPKPKLSKSTSFSSAASRPGAATKRPIPAKPRQSLKRVLTDERERERRSVSHTRGRSMSLMRSATAPIIPGLKREASEAPSLSSIPAAESQSLKANRPGVLNSKRFSQREVDLSSLVTEVNSKGKKQASIEAELKEAISALKKPNRELAGRAMVEIAEIRVGSASRSRKSKKPIRNPLFQEVQISATPRMTRQKDVLTEVQQPTLSEMVEEVERSVLPPSSLPRIPQSIARPSREAPAKNPLLSAFNATPTRKSITQLNPATDLSSISPVNHRGYLPSSPLQIRRSSGQLFAAVPDPVVRTSSCPSIDLGLQETPVKNRAEAMQVHGHPTAPTWGSDKENGRQERTVSDFELKGPARMSQEDSIYKSLGWDEVDDFDELL